MSSLVLYIADKIKMSKILAAIIIYSNSCAGGFNPFTLGGKTTYNFTEKLGYSPEITSAYRLSLGRNMFIVHTLIFIIGYFLLKGYKNEKLHEIEKAEKLNDVQIRTIIVVCCIFLTIMIPSIWLAIAPDNVTLKSITKMPNPTFLCFIGAVLAILFKLGNEREAFKNIPWDLIFMIGALSILIALSKKVGLWQSLAIS